MFFKREERYIVLKKPDIEKSLTAEEVMDLDNLCNKVNYFRGFRGPLKCVVVEEDWPEYEIVWKLIEDRVNGNSRGTA